MLARTEAFFYAASSGAPSVLWVATTGSDANAGTQALPKLTINGAIAALPDPAPGWVVMVGNGTYTQNVIVNRGGTASGQLIIQAVNRGLALIRPTSGDHGIHIRKDYVTLDGFDVSGPNLNYHGIAADRLNADGNERGVHHITVRYCTSHGNKISGIGLAYGDYYLIEHCVTYGNCNNCPQSIQGSGISIYQAREFDAAAGTHNLIHSNISYSNQILRLTNGAGGPQYTPFPSAEPTHTDGNGIIIDDFRNSQSTIGSGTIYLRTTIVENNLCYLNGGKGIQVFKSNNVSIKNNTCWSNLRDTLSTATFCDELSNSQSSNNRWTNNIGVVVGTTYVAQQNSATITRRAIGDRDIGGDRNVDTIWTNNLTYDESTPGSNSMIMSAARISPDDATLTEPPNLFAVNPLFVDTVGDNFHLQTGSPAIDAGTAAQGLATYDLDGNARVAGASIDIGCYEAEVSAILVDGLSHARKVSLTTVIAQITGTHTNLPILFTLANLPSEMFDADGSFPAQNGGGDIRFTSDSAGTTLLPCDVRSFVTNNNPASGYAEIWVKLPNVRSSQTDTIYCWYNTPGTDSQPAVGAANGRNAVWSDYVMVTHDLLTDSAGNYTLTPTGGATQTGPFGLANGARGFGATLGVATSDRVTTSLTAHNNAGRTYQSWWNARALGGSSLGRIVDKGVELWYVSSTRETFDRGATTGGQWRVTNTFSLSTWYAGAATYIGTAVSNDPILYRNGVAQSLGSINTNPTGTITDNANAYILGNRGGGDRGWDGILAEFRIADSIISADQLITEYRNQSAPGSFVTVGTPGAP